MSENHNELLSNILGPLELEVMKVLWSKKEATVQEVLADLNKQNEYAYTTIMTIMNRLDKKRILTRNKVGKGYQYKARYNQDELVQHTSSKKVEQLLGNYGDVAIAQFVDAVGHNPDQLNKLKQLIQNLENGEES
ncbi:BlaI/MecI/CopY family transcriptional regulator (plasmid) [Priestia megaterium]|uniref:BlaI/MecI/CopY family transcriptional regulator n=1 Tax=Priestia TaxID=2800373 RepID=UPI00196A6B12|nr:MULTISPECIES: BlaI/MecI/CopY family transcriptional regulator [Priestia]MCW1048992.1 BlaI/MecI/CopY family transcriptional regulator [Priestia sp. JV24]QSF42090.1 BlaI/MecI/CopY family transcriptional regulator [Priestia megaterium]